jgi:transcriptional regulator of arginine metabolism
MMNKTERLYEIRRIVAAGAVASQEELRRELARRGCRVTQATLSRDLNDLGVAWVPGPGGGHYPLSAAGASPALRANMGSGVTEIAANETMALVRTMPGAAPGVAEYLDGQRLAGVLGTLAGDNIVLVIPCSVRGMSALLRELKKRLLAA